MDQLSAEMLRRLAENLIPWWGAIKSMLIVAGLYVSITGILGLARAGGRESLDLRATIWHVVAGVMLIDVTAALDVFTMSLFNSQSIRQLSYHSASGSFGMAAAYIGFALLCINIIGLIFFAKGCFMLKDQCLSSQVTLGKALTHLVGGAACVKITAVITMIGNSLGGDAQSFVQKILSL